MAAARRKRGDSTCQSLNLHGQGAVDGRIISELPVSILTPALNRAIREAAGMIIARDYLSDGLASRHAERTGCEPSGRIRRGERECLACTVQDIKAGGAGS